MITFLTTLHIAIVVILVISVLLQSGKGAEISASFGGSSQTVFGTSGGTNFFQKLTYTLAACFMATSLTLTVLPSKTKHSVFEGYTPPPSTSSLPHGGTVPTGNPNSLPEGGDAPVANKTGASAPAAANEKSFTGKAPTSGATTTTNSSAPAKPATDQKK